MIARLLGVSAIMLLLAGCATLAVVPEKTTEPRVQTETTEGAPERFIIIPDDYHAEYAGRAEDGRLFFIATPFDAGTQGGNDGKEFIATFYWKADGSYDSMDVDAFGPRDTIDRDVYDAIMARHISNLGDYELTEISVAPFSDTAFDTEMGFIYTETDGYGWVNLLPGDYIAFTPPWDGMYDT